MLIIDSHVHTGVNWAEPVEVLSFQMESNGVSHAVLIQHNGNYNNSYVLDCVRRFGNRYKAIGYVNAQDAAKLKILEDFHKAGGSGIRIDIRKADSWDPGDPLFKLVGELGMIVSVIGKAEDFASARFKTLLDNCPKTRFNLEHLAQSPHQAPPKDYKSTLECARWPTTTTTVPGLGELLHRPALLPASYPFAGMVPEAYQMAKEAFGVQRMMWGSNYPPCSALEGYRNALEGIRTMSIFQNGDDLEWIMGKTAAKVWGFSS